MQDTQLAIFLSPHLDDIPLSCGGAVARLSRAGARCIEVVVFTALPPTGTPLSPFAQEMHDKWERAGAQGAQGGRSIIEARREEEQQAARLLGLEVVMLDLHDAVYRRGPSGEYLYDSNKALFGEVAREERVRLVPQIAAEVTRIARETGARGRVRVFAPLGIGRHVDHQLVFWAARRLAPRYGVLYYEDFPYVSKEGNPLGKRIEELHLPMQPRVLPIPDLIGVKIAAIARHKSQLEMLFGSNEAMPAAVRAYAQSVGETSGGRGYAERFWYIPPMYTLRET